MGAALASLHGLAFLAALGLIWWRDHATVMRWRSAPTLAGGTA
jgi:hypothetical protein